MRLPRRPADAGAEDCEGLKELQMLARESLKTGKMLSWAAKPA